MRKVFIVCEPLHQENGISKRAVDLSPAAMWGEPIVVLPYMQSLLAPETTIDAIAERLKDYTPDDFIVPIGDPVLMCMVVAIAAKISGGKVRLLKWDRRGNVYIPITCDLYRSL